MEKKTTRIFILIAVLSMLIFGLFPGNSGGVLYALAVPFSAIGKGLRWLSLSGVIGNVIAIVLYAAIGISPLLLLIKRRKMWEDWILVALSALLFYVVYLMINPGFMPANLEGQVGKLIYSSAIYSTLVSWGILKLLRRSGSIKQENVYGILRVLLYGCAMVWVITGFGVGFGTFRTEIDVLRSGNTLPGINLVPTFLFRFLIFMNCALEYSLDAILMLLGVKLLRELEGSPYSDACQLTAEKIAVFCKRMLMILTFTNLSLNLGQILWASVLLDIDATLQFPIFSMTLAFAVLALTKLLNQGRELKEDNDLFI